MCTRIRFGPRSRRSFSYCHRVDAAGLKIDHVTIAGAKLEAIRDAFTAATGLPTEYGGRHANHATEMALTSFPDGSYLELMGIQAQADSAALAAHEWRKFLEDNSGPCAFAIRPGAPIRIAGKEPQRNGRTRPDGTRIEWEITDIGTGVRGTFFPFLIRDLTPRDNRAYLKGKPTTDRMLGVAKVVVGVRDLEAAIALYRNTFSLPAPRKERHTEFGADLAWFEDTPIVLAQGLASRPLADPAHCEIRRRAVRFHTASGWWTRRSIPGTLVRRSDLLD